ncbi:MAG: hypothetical protein C4523_03520 [Myxococcales bacterium]|nr:MAG: hypothetical protein C4523_03520 [Myxococcales bacterium]
MQFSPKWSLWILAGAAIVLCACGSVESGTDGDSGPYADDDSLFDWEPDLDPGDLTDDEPDGDPAEDTDAADADLSDGDEADGDLPTDGDATDGDTPDGDTADGDLPDGDDDAAEQVDDDISEAVEDVETADESDEPPLVWDAGLLRDKQTIGCTFENQRTAMKDGVLLDLWDVSYISYESIDSQLQPILIRGFAAKPAGDSGPMPGLVLAHGLGGCTSESNAPGLAALTGMAVLAYTGPGGSGDGCVTSEGLPAGHDSSRRLFDTIPDPRGSWFWAHAVAAMRGLTCLSTRPEVDDNRLGMTGFSAGGVVTLISAAVDSRIKAAVPLSGTGAWDVAMQSPAAWQYALLSQAGLTTSSPEWRVLQAEIVPHSLLPRTQAKILMTNGSTDEFFPLTAHVATYAAIPGDDKRTAIAANFDHGCYSLTGIESAANIETRAERVGAGNQRAWFRHWFGTDGDYSYYPMTPAVSVTPIGAAMYATAVVDSGGGKLNVESVKFWWSNDDAFYFGSVDLTESGGGLWGKEVLATLQANTVYFVEVTYKTQDWFFPERFILTSAPVVPASPAPHIRDIVNCL